MYDSLAPYKISYTQHQNVFVNHCHKPWDNTNFPRFQYFWFDKKHHKNLYIFQSTYYYVTLDLLPKSSQTAVFVY
jgi:hypothetical protein